MKLTLLRLGVGGIFIAFSLDKVLDPLHFAQAVTQYRLLPLELVPMFAMTLPWLELSSGILLVLGLFTDAAALVLTLLCGMFGIATLTALMRGLDIDCGCFHEAPLRWWNPLLDLILGLAAARIWHRGPGRWACDERLDRFLNREGATTEGP